MDTHHVKQPDKKSKEIANILISLGMSRAVARTVAYLQNVDEAASIELEKSTRLKQPEISIATRELIERDWINLRKEKKPGKGRPLSIFSLKIGFNEIVDQLEKDQKKAVDEKRSKVERLKKLRKD